MQPSKSNGHLVSAEVQLAARTDGLSLHTERQPEKRDEQRAFKPVTVDCSPADTGIYLSPAPARVSFRLPGEEQEYPEGCATHGPSREEKGKARPSSSAQVVQAYASILQRTDTTTLNGAGHPQR